MRMNAEILARFRRKSEPDADTTLPITSPSTPAGPVQAPEKPRLCGGFTWLDGHTSLQGMEPFDVVEVGAEGMRVHMRHPADAGRRLVARIPVNDEDICVEAEVEWSREWWGQYEASVRFNFLDDGDRRRLQALL